MSLNPYIDRANYYANKLLERKDHQANKKYSKHTAEINSIYDGLAVALSVRGGDEECREYLHNLFEDVHNKKLSPTTRTYLKSINIGD